MSDRYVVFVGDDVWRAAVVHEGEVRVMTVSFANDTTPEVRADALKEQLAEVGYAGDPVVLAPASSWCLAATISTEGLQRRGRRRAMGFRLEEHLPISAEEIVADYVDLTGGEALAVCAPLERLEPVVKALTSCGVEVRHICPATLLAAACAIEHNPGVNAVLIARASDGGDDDTTRYDLVELKKGRLARWWWLAQDVAAVGERLTAHDGPMHLAVIGRDESPTCEGHECTVVPQVSPDEAAARQGAKVLEEATSPWIDLRRDALAAPDRWEVYRRPLGALVAATVLLLVCVSGVMQWRGRQYASLREQYLRQMGDVFRETLPDQRLPGPGNIRGRLASERQRMEGLGQQADDADGTHPVSALVHLRNLLTSLPKDGRCRIVSLDIAPDLLYVKGEAVSGVEGDRVADALRRTGRYEVDAPGTRGLKETGVSFQFAARPCPGPAARKAGER